MSDSIFYRPADGTAADFIPFFWNGNYHLFYLKNYGVNAEMGEGTPWFQLVTRDFVNFEDWGESLARGARNEQDAWVFTGSVIERDGKFHIFYTGHNSHFVAEAKPQEAVMHATSDDLSTWTKHPEDKFFAPDEYEMHDWRDPFVFWNGQVGEYWMLLAARRPEGPARHRGFTALMRSKDLKRWELHPPFWAPDLYYTHECPDLFRIGDWWYLLYSTFSEASLTHYRMSRSLDGPWIAPPDDAFDTRAYYAAKTVGDGDKRYLFGWLATREGDSDAGGWQWGGNLVVHELYQRPDGTLAARAPESVLKQFSKALPIEPHALLGEWETGEGTFSPNDPHRFSALTLGVESNTMLLETTITIEENRGSAGVLLRASNDLENYYVLRLEPSRQRISIDMWPRPFGAGPFMLERPARIEIGGPMKLQVLTSESCLIAYLNEECAFSYRLYNHATGSAGFFTQETPATFSATRVATL